MEKFKHIILGLIAIIVLVFAYNITYGFAEPKAYDYMTKNMLVNKFQFDNKKNVYGHDDIVLIMIDSKAVNKYRWPWKRELYAKIFNYLYEYSNPKVVIHDAVVNTLDKDTPQSDKIFFDSIKKFENHTAGLYPMIKSYEDESMGRDYDKIITEKFGIKAVYNTTPPNRLYKSTLIFPEEYIKSIKYAGSVAIYPGFIDGNITSKFRDSIFRNQEPIVFYQNKVFPSLAFSAYLISNNNPGITIYKNYIDIPELHKKIPVKNTNYQTIIPIKFYKLHKTGYSHIKYSAIDIMDSYDKIQKGQKPIIDPSVFNNKFVIIGANVPIGNGLNDNSMTPIMKQSGTDIVATSLDNILHNDFLTIIPVWINVIVAILCMFLTYIIIQKNFVYKAIIYTLALAVLYLILTAVLFYNAIVINILTPIVMILFSAIIAFTHKFLIENRNKEKVKKAMGKYMSEDVMKKILKNIDNLGLGGKRATVTVLFSDIRGFTSLSEQLSPQEVSEILNEYFSEMEPIVTKYNGIINKFIGDAVMAVFGEPIQDEKHPLNAIKCAVEMLEKVQELHKKWEEENKPKFEIGIGINTGEVFVGNIGSVNRMEYTVIGDTVNLASRLESYNKTYKTKILISSSTYEITKDYIETNKIADVDIRGKAKKLDIYEVIALNHVNK